MAILMFFFVTLISLTAVTADTQIDNNSQSLEGLYNIETLDNVNLSQNESEVELGSSNSQPTKNQNSSESVSAMAAGSDSVESFSITQIKEAASKVRNNVETNRTLPSSVLIGSSQVTMHQFLELLTTALLQINSGNNNPIPLMNFSAPANPIENIHAGNIPKAEFLKIAKTSKTTWTLVVKHQSLLTKQAWVHI